MGTTKQLSGIELLKSISVRLQCSFKTQISAQYKTNCRRFSNFSSYVSLELPGRNGNGDGKRQADRDGDSER
jgi:hypothetical protein